MPPKKRDRPRVKGSWRDQGKGECFTRTNASGGKYVVCNDPPRGSRGQKGVYKGTEGGRKQTKAVKKIQAVVRGNIARKGKRKQVFFKDFKLFKGDKRDLSDALKKGKFELVLRSEGNITGVGATLKKKGDYFVKNLPSQEGFGSSNTQKFNLYKEGEEVGGKEFQFNPYGEAGKKAMEEGKIKFFVKGTGYKFVD